MTSNAVKKRQRLKPLPIKWEY